MIGYRYTIGNTIIETLDLSTIPSGVDYETFEIQEPTEVIEVPQIITRRQFKIALAVLGKNENDILNGINQLPEPTRTIATISYTEAGTFERSNAELIFVGKMFLQMTDEQIDNVFIVGNQY